MEIKQLEYVLMAADMGSFNKASEYLYTTQSNVSKVIGSLEAELGYRIFKRQGGGVLLTDAGKALYDQSQQIIGILNNLKDLKTLEDRKCFHVATVASNLIGEAFAELVNRRNENEFCLELWEGSISDVIGVVDRGEAGMGFLYIGEKQKEAFHTMLAKKEMEFRELLPAQVVLCVRKGHPLAGQTSIRPEQLQDLRFVKYREDTLSQTYHLQQVYSDLGLENRMAHAVEIDSDSVLMSILRKTDCVYLCFSGYPNRKTTGKEILEIPVEYSREGFALGYIKRKSTQLSEVAREFLEMIAPGVCAGGIKG
ncbi:MAG: LysR family transcriptional regulator [Oscillospiraceae bacterium]|nr:LysR family transcriptional regulator [Oscillospiraceae bacterium]